MKWMKLFLILICLVGVSCKVPGQADVKQEGYRYVHGEDVKTDEKGQLIGHPQWFPTHYILGDEADSFYIYGNFDSIFVRVPPSKGGIPKMYRKIHLRADSWKPPVAYDRLQLAGVYDTAELPGFFTGFYFSSDRTGVLRVVYSSPGFMVDATLFTKDSINFLQRKGILITPPPLP
jgi:hypothetical protein